MAYNKNRKVTFDEKFTVGGWCCHGIGGDCYPAYVHAVSDSGKEMIVRDVNYKVKDMCTDKELAEGTHFRGAVGAYGETMDLVAFVHAAGSSETTVKFRRGKPRWRGAPTGWGYGNGLAASRDPHF